MNRLKQEIKKTEVAEKNCCRALKDCNCNKAEVEAKRQEIEAKKSGLLALACTIRHNKCFSSNS